MFALAQSTQAAVGALSSQIADINFNLGNLRRDANAGLASTAAMSSLPQAMHAGKMMIAMGSGIRAGQMGMAFGLSYRSRDDRATINARLATDRSATTAAAGVGLEF